MKRKRKKKEKGKDKTEEGDKNRSSLLINEDYYTTVVAVVVARWFVANVVRDTEHQEAKRTYHQREEATEEYGVWYEYGAVCICAELQCSTRRGTKG